MFIAILQRKGEAVLRTFGPFASYEAALSWSLAYAGGFDAQIAKLEAPIDPRGDKGT